MPTGETKDGKTLYLDELFLDSPHIGDYPHPKWIHLAVSEAKVSKDLTTTQAKSKMRSAAQVEFDKGCDLPTVTLKVDFINCAETEEYRQYRFLQNIFLGDVVRVIARRIGVAVSMRLTQYTYDCLTRKYTAITLGTVADTIEGNTISSRQLASGTITGTKLALNSVGAGQIKDGSVGTPADRSRSDSSLAHRDGSDPDGAHPRRGHHEREDWECRNRYRKNPRRSHHEREDLQCGDRHRQDTRRGH
jgi:hypothetical protein